MPPDRWRPSLEYHVCRVRQPPDLPGISSMKRQPGQGRNTGGIEDGHRVAPVLVGDWRKSGLKFLAIGLGAAAIGFFVGRLFNATGA
jgi:hypothetical protein